MKLIECVPNVSEGRDQNILQALSAAVEAVPGVRLLDVDPGAETNRTVFTFVGDASVIADAAFAFIARAQALIDMRRHQGAHARIGATDVCPFVPLAGATMEDCVALARKLGERVGRELEIPVYLYEAAATSPARKNLADIRKGEYEGLKDKLADPASKPDFGPAAFGERQAKSGASVIGARPFLIAYNVNLNTKDKKLANEIAFSIRESGRAKKDDKGQFVLDAKGEKVMVAGTLKAVKATGWVIEEYGCAQISMNLTDMGATSLHQAFEECVRQADRLGLRVTGSELVGLVPKAALVDAGRHFLRKMGKPDFAPEAELITTAVRSLGLSELAPFEPHKKIIEARIAAPGALAQMSVAGFVDALSSDAPAPGGGSASALCGALGAGLASMVASLTCQKREHAADHAELARVGAAAQALKARLTEAIDRDTEAFNQVLAAMRLAKTDPARAPAIEAANQGATLVPLAVMQDAAEALALALVACEKGMPQSLSDAAVGALTAFTAVEGAYLNVCINLKSAKDDAFVTRVKKQAEEIMARARAMSQRAQTACERLRA